MEARGNMLEALFGVILGGLVTLFVAASVEKMRMPSLRLLPAPDSTVDYPPDRPAKRARWVTVDLQNEPLPRWAWWMQRSSAVRCHGTVQFRYTDGKAVFDSPMPIRWARSPEPLPMRLIVGQCQLPILDDNLLAAESTVDVYPGESERLAVAACFDDDVDCYGWCNESYLEEPKWRSARWRLAPGEYTVTISVTSSGQKCEATFRLVNGPKPQDIRLEPLKEVPS